MSVRLYAATTNSGKIKEFNQMTQVHGVVVMPLPGMEELPVVEETGATFSANARLKAEAYSLAAQGDAAGQLVFADDSGLCVDVLHGAPGVFSARYALYSEGKDISAPPSSARIFMDSDNNSKLLHELKHFDATHRQARFVCLIAVARSGKTLAEFTGEAHGTILDSPRGSGGFGYDPLFYFPELKKTFAELSVEEKSKYSHRGIAFRKMLASLDGL